MLCTVLGEPDVEVEFRWIFPGQKVSATPEPWLALSHLVGDHTRFVTRARECLSSKIFRSPSKYLVLKKKETEEWMAVSGNCSGCICNGHGSSLGVAVGKAKVTYI